MQWLLDWLNTLYNWLNKLDGALAALVGGLILAAIVGLFKFALIPLAKKVFRKVGRLLYPIASGAIILDRNVALPRYLKSIQRVVGRLRNPWLVEGQELKDIFIPLSATTKAFGSERTELKQVFQSTRCVVLIGEPGSGKTTALKSIAMDCIHRRYAASGNFIPVFVELHQVMSSGVSLDDFVIKTFQDNGFPRPRRLIKKLRKSGQLVFLLDALDEVDDKEARKRVLADIRNLMSSEKKSTNPCRVFMTSRPTGYQGQLSGLVEKTLYMADFTPAQISKFVNNWDFRPPKSQEKLISVIMDRRPILEICRNPLMLTIVTSLYRETDYQLPDSREDFYKICIDALLKRWDAVKELESRNKFLPALKEAFLQGLAFDVLSDWSNTFRITWLSEKVEAFLSERKRNDIEPEIFLEEIIRSGLLGRLETGEVFFAHKTFAEALAAPYLRNKPQILIERWSKDPDAWIEVCSLYVADPLTSIDDIEILIEDAKSRDDWPGLLMIAGEAHTVPNHEQAWIGTTLLSQRERWPTLNRRAITALSRMKIEPQALLTAMVEEGSEAVSQEAIYALGYSGKNWAIKLIVKSLTEEKLRGTAITSLAALGDSAVPILRDLISTNSDKEDLLVACIGVAENIGSNSALEVILPLVWSNEASVSLAVSRVVMVALNNAAYRQSLESGQLSLIKPPSLSNDIDQLKRWALPRFEAGSDLVASYYCKMIDTVAEHVRVSEDFPDEILEDMPADLLISIIIMSSEDLSVTQERDKRREKLPGYINVGRERVKVDAVRRVVSLRSYEKNKSLWARAKGEPQKDIRVEETGSYVFGGISLFVTMAPLVAAILADMLTPWWLLSIIPLVGVTIWYTKDNKDFIILLVGPAVIGITPGMMRHEFDFTDSKDVVYLILFISFLSIFGTAVYAAVLLGGYWWLCFILSAIQPFFPDILSESYIVFWRRSNPLLTLLYRLST